jgi:hypothetical protein
MLQIKNMGVVIRYNIKLASVCGGGECLGCGCAGEP